MAAEGKADTEGGWFADAEHLNIPLMTPDEVAPMTVDFRGEEWEAAVKSAMETFGVVVVTNVLSPEQCKDAEAAFGRDLRRGVDGSKMASLPEGLATITEGLLKAEDAAVPGEFPWRSIIGPVGRGLASGGGLCQGEFAWGLRQHSGIRDVFAALHDTPSEELCVSADVPFFLPPSAPADAAVGQRLHADFNSHVQPSGSWASYQGVAYVWDSSHSGASTTVVQPGTHTEAFQALMADKSAKERLCHSVQVNFIQDEALKAQFLAQAALHARRVPVPAGALLLWDSRLIHQGWSGGARLALPIVWEPIARREPDAVTRKGAAAVAGVPTNHWASMGTWHALGFRRKLKKPALDPAAPQDCMLPLAERHSWALDPSSLPDATPLQWDKLGRLVERMTQPGGLEGAKKEGRLASFATQWKAVTGESVDAEGLDLGSVTDMLRGLLRPEVAALF